MTWVATVDVDGQLRTVRIERRQLLGASQVPTGVGSDHRHAELSAVIFSNACSIAKLNRVAVSGRGPPEGLAYTRIGKFFGRTPDALEGIPFCLDVTSDEYRKLWPQRYEPWSAELEVFHNPLARHLVPFEFLPKATQWFDQGGEKVCTCFYDTSILGSGTVISKLSDPAPMLEDFLARTNIEEQTDESAAQRSMVRD